MHWLPLLNYIGYRACAMCKWTPWKDAHWIFHNRPSENIFVAPGALTIDTIQTIQQGHALLISMCHSKKSSGNFDCWNLKSQNISWIFFYNWSCASLIITKACVLALIVIILCVICIRNGDFLSSSLCSHTISPHLVARAHLAFPETWSSQSGRHVTSAYTSTHVITHVYQTCRRS